ncbi:MAG: trigger factor [Solirubrobacterales bacterium]|jgi:trigger factor|nr:trigger factor [Solirubrobacterales bacterium]
MAVAEVKTKVTELPESRVRVEAEVPAAEVERRLQQTARALGRDMRVPGFRKGKVPPPVVIRRVGREALLDEAVKESLASWYVGALDAAGVHPVGDPQLDLGDLPAEGEPLTFSIEIGVRPPATLGTYKGLEVGRREPEVDEQRVDEEVGALRERLARLESAERPAEQGDFVVMDYVGTLDGEPFEGGEGRDQMIELGSGRLIPGFEEQLLGAQAGEERTLNVTFPEDYGAEHLAGQEAQFAATVKEVKTKLLPELDDDFASEAAGFDTLDELRADIRAKLAEAETRAIDEEFREAVVDAAAAEATIDLPDHLIEGRAGELWDRLMRTLGRQGISKDAYLRISDKTEEQIVEEAKPDAERALKREAVLAAVVEAEGIAPSDEDILGALEHEAVHHQNTTPEKLRKQLEASGRLDEVVEDLAARQAVDLLAEAATPITVEQAQARDKLWTPGKEREEGAGQLWTPGS